MLASAHRTGAVNWLAPEAVGLGLVGPIKVSLITHAQEQIDSFHQMLAKLNTVLDPYKTIGDADNLLKVAVADLSGLSVFFRRTPSQHKDVAHIKTTVVLTRIRVRSLLPVAR